MTVSIIIEVTTDKNKFQSVFYIEGVGRIIVFHSNEFHHVVQIPLEGKKESLDFFAHVMEFIDIGQERSGLEIISDIYDSTQKNHVVENESFYFRTSSFVSDFENLETFDQLKEWSENPREVSESSDYVLA
jgi:hypothetical protein